MSEHEHEFVETHIECDLCGSRDAAAVRSDGSRFCFSCDTSRPASKDEAQSTGQVPPLSPPAQARGAQQAAVQSKRPKGQVQALRDRGLTDLATLKKYQYEVDADSNHLAHYYDHVGQWTGTKVRTPDKRFWWQGQPVTSGLYGRHVVPKPNAHHDKIVVTEGELDAITVRAATKLHAVSLPGGAQSAEKVLADEISWSYLTSFNTVIVAVDGDEQGQRAAEILCSSLCMSHRDIDVRCVSWPTGRKDASDVYVHDDSRTLADLIDAAPSWRPSGIYSASELEHLLDEADDDGLAFPFAALQDMLRGMRKELITVTAGTGVGKSTLCRTLALHLLKQHGQRVGMVMLEESNRRTLRALIGMSVSKPLIMDAKCMSIDDQKEALRNLAKDGNLWLYDHFGSTDAEGLLARLSWLAAGCKCDYIILDHITMATTLGMNQQHLDERRIIDAICTDIRSKIVERTGTGVIMVAHTRKPSTGDHSTGTASLSLSDIRGSGAPAALSDAVIGLERAFDENKEPIPNTVRVNIMKNRYTGETSHDAGSIYFNRETGCLEERHDTFRSDF